MAAYDDDPAVWLGESYSFSTPTVSFSTAEVAVSGASTPVGDNLYSAISDAHAADGTGDFAEMLFAILNRVYTVYAANTAPTKWSMSRSISTSGTTGTVSFGLSFQTTIATPPTATVTDEA